MEIEVGEYVKLDNGKIGKVIAVEKGSIMLDLRSNRWVGLCCIKNHSKNIIDLIEEGDYVNGKKVLRINDYGDFKRADFNLDYDDGDAVYNDDIKTILTKEQYEQNCYKVGEE